VRATKDWRIFALLPHLGQLEQDFCTRAWITGLAIKCVTGAHVGHFTRPKIPYPVRWEDIEFNQVASVRTVFRSLRAGHRTVLAAAPRRGAAWLAQTDFRDWRAAFKRAGRSATRNSPPVRPGSPDCFLHPFECAAIY